MKKSIILPAKNESLGLAKVLPELRQRFPDAELIVVDDGSTDNTIEIVSQYVDRLVRHPYSKGNGAAIKSGARVATGDLLVFMDADGQHQPADVARLLAELADKQLDMVVGARGMASQASLHRGLANVFYNRFASWVAGHRIHDLTSGMRAVRARLFCEFLPLLPNGFSYPTTITMCFFRAGYSVGYLPIVAPPRLGKSHVKIWRDGLRFLLIIFKIGTLFSPLKLFAPIALAFFLTGLGYYGYTYTTVGRFTNMSGLLFSNSVLIFLFGLVAEQITSLMYLRSAEQHQETKHE
ncbi:glycosyltransferase family 2 protein [Chitinolyticbacter meiyuanensis]|uniref:glycosyltransferase family 2 protein n=1 Tax=Chitinolyticbacter meiyuanensis TaxID=682798 RepID=UPI0011E5B552|nr:glycosyltransferase family 2 protein [Chitinolyticbacter meiyuanensis]